MDERCAHCEGSGTVWLLFEVGSGETGYDEEDCPVCEGEGWLSPECDVTWRREPEVLPLDDSDIPF